MGWLGYGKTVPAAIEIPGKLHYNNTYFYIVSVAVRRCAGRQKKGSGSMESVILQQPLVVAIVLYGAALFLLLCDRFYRMTPGTFTLISTALVAVATAYSLINGASLWECATVVLVFLLLNMGVKE